MSPSTPSGWFLSDLFLSGLTSRNAWWSARAFIPERASICRPLRSLEHQRPPLSEELLFKRRHTEGKRLTCGLFFAQQERQFAELQIQLADGALALVQPSVEFALAQGQYVGADFEGLLLFGAGALCGFEFQLGAAAPFVEGLHPERLCDVGDGFGEAVQGGGAGVQAGGEMFPPGVEQGAHGIG